jgi:hypothetical protein
MQNEPKQLIYIGDPDDSDPVVECPVCGSKGPLMEKFSLLSAGFNGIKSGDSDDVDLQECGSCGERLEW